MKYRDHPLLKITTTAVMMALTCLLTLTIRIPSPTNGYLNLGDCAVLLSGWLLGPFYGMLAGGLGSALADLLAGYPVYIPGTLLIKAAMALIVSLLPSLFARHPRAGWITGAVTAEAVMVTGYYLYEAAVIKEGFVPALAGVSGNVMQGIVGAAGSFVLVAALSRVDLLKAYGVHGFVKKQP
ncbi:MAG: ECF transporter S component [Clostridia bacterium]|nr:ECF transporter S component [Clostridia bacterium]